MADDENKPKSFSAEDVENIRSAAEAANKYAIAIGEVNEGMESQIHHARTLASSASDQLKAIAEAKTIGQERLKQIYEEQQLVNKMEFADGVSREEKAKARLALSAALGEEKEQIEALAATEEDVLDKLQQIVAEAEELVDQFGEAVDAGKDLDKTIGEAASALTGIGPKWRMSVWGSTLSAAETRGWSEALKDVGKGLADTFSPLNVAGSLMAGVAQQSFLMAMSVDNMTSEFNKNTGAGGVYNEMLIDGMENNREFGADAGETAQALQGLTSSMAAFGRMSKQAQTNFHNLAIKLQEIGVAADDAGEMFMNATKILGMTDEQVPQLTADLSALADTLGTSLGPIVSEFNAAMGDLAIYGADAQKVFFRLKGASDKLGISVNSLVGAMKEMDTIQGAAKRAGELNAVLQGQFLDTHQLLNASYEDRIVMVRQALASSGKEWATMGRAERQMVAQAAGFANAGEAAKFMSVSVSDLKKSMDEAGKSAGNVEDIEKKAAAAQSVQDKMKQTMQDLAIAAKPFVWVLQKISSLLAAWMNNPFLKWASIAVAVIILFANVMNAYHVATKAAAAANTLHNFSLRGGILAVKQYIVGLWAKITGRTAEAQATAAALAVEKLKIVADAEAAAAQARNTFFTNQNSAAELANAGNTAANTTATGVNTTATGLNSTAELVNTESIVANEVATVASTVATAADTTATGADTIVEGANTTAKKLGFLATMQLARAKAWSTIKTGALMAKEVALRVGRFLMIPVTWALAKATAFLSSSTGANTATTGLNTVAELANTESTVANEVATLASTVATASDTTATGLGTVAEGASTGAKNLGFIASMRLAGAKAWSTVKTIALVAWEGALRVGRFLATPITWALAAATNFLSGSTAASVVPSTAAGVGMTVMGAGAWTAVIPVAILAVAIGFMVIGLGLMAMAVVLVVRSFVELIKLFIKSPMAAVKAAGALTLMGAALVILGAAMILTTVAMWLMVPAMIALTIALLILSLGFVGIGFAAMFAVIPVGLLALAVGALAFDFVLMAIAVSIVVLSFAYLIKLFLDSAPAALEAALALGLMGYAILSLALGLGALLLVAIPAIPALIALSVGLMFLSWAFSGIAEALADMPEDSLGLFVGLMETINSLTGATTDRMFALSDAIGDVADALSELSMFRVLTFTMMLDQLGYAGEQVAKVTPPMVTNVEGLVASASEYSQIKWDFMGFGLLDLFTGNPFIKMLTAAGGAGGAGGTGAPGGKGGPGGTAKRGAPTTVILEIDGRELGRTVEAVLNKRNKLTAAI